MRRAGCTATKFMGSWVRQSTLRIVMGAAQALCIWKLPRASVCTSLIYMVNDSCSRFCGKFPFTIFISHDSMKVSPEATILERSAFLLSTVPQAIRHYFTLLYVACACSARCKFSRSVARSSREGWIFVNNGTSQCELECRRARVVASS